jgi:hypothetical protein
MSALASGSDSRARAASFDPRSVTFVSSQTGWVLGTTSCASAGRCLELRRTGDSGTSWSLQRLPASLLSAADRKVGGQPATDAGTGLSVRFADPRDGWIYGQLAVASSAGVGTEPNLWATHDGGRTWRKQRLSWLGKQSSILDLEAAAGAVHLLTTDDSPGVTIASSPTARDGWHSSSKLRLGLPAGGGDLAGAIVLAGATGWFIEGNNRGTTGSARLVNGRWVAWVPPCASVGGSFAVPAAATPSDLVAACVMGGFASDLSKAAPKGATLGSTWLYLSRSGGKSFAAGPELGRRGPSFDGVLASPSPGTILIARQNGTGQELRASFDGGKHWTTVYRGDLAYLGFATPSQGVGIVELASGKAGMIMTFDGGHHWSAVRF